MLIYILIMTAIAILFYREGQKLVADSSTLLQEFSKDPIRKKGVLRLLRRLCLTATSSAFLMLVCYFVSRLHGTLHRPLAALSILLYTAGFLYAAFQGKNL